MEDVSDETTFKSGFVVLLGRPNTGKSTLLNALVGRKVAIVSSKPQTTRNRIAGIVNLEDAQIVFLDTPGMHKPKHALGASLVAAAKRALPDAEVVCLVLDGSEAMTPDDQRAASLVMTTKAVSVLVINKLDRMKPHQLSERQAEFARCEFQHTIAVSAQQGTNLPVLLQLIESLLPAGPRYFPEDMVTDHAMEFRVAELIREAALQFTHQEVPHALAVQVEAMEPRRDDLTYVAANIIVERESHKGIVIGSKGSMLRQIGQLSRAQLEPLLGQQVFLELRVKVREKWRQDESMLQRLGYAE